VITRLLRRKLSPETEIFSEAQALLDDGLDLPFVLGLYPDDTEWLEPLLTTSLAIGESYAADEPSYYFEGSLKSRFIAAGQAARAPLPELAPVPATYSGSGALARMQTALAGAVVALTLGAMGILTLGFVTADQALPGDWNYAFKRTGERIEYTLSRGDARVNVQVDQSQTRVWELKRLDERGEVSAADIDKLRHVLEEVQTLARDNQLDDVQAAKVRAVGEAASAVLTGAAQKNPELAPAVEDALPIAAGLGTVTTLDPVTPTPTPGTPESTAEPTPELTETPEPAESETPDPATVTTDEDAEPSSTASPAPDAGADPVNPPEAP
jgi:hypothetical protein